MEQGGNERSSSEFEAEDDSQVLYLESRKRAAEVVSEEKPAIHLSLSNSDASSCKTKTIGDNETGFSVEDWETEDEGTCQGNGEDEGSGVGEISSSPTSLGEVVSMVEARAVGGQGSAQKPYASQPPSPILMPNNRFTTVGQVAVPPASVSKRPPATEGLETTSAAERVAGEKTREKSQEEHREMENCKNTKALGNGTSKNYHKDERQDDDKVAGGRAKLPDSTDAGGGFNPLQNPVMDESQNAMKEGCASP